MQGVGNGWIAYIVLRTAVTRRAAAAVEVLVLARARTAHAALGVAADVDVGHGGRVGIARGGAFGARAGILRQAGCWVAVCGAGITLFDDLLG